MALSSHSSSRSAAVVEQSGRRVHPFLDPSATPVGVAFLFLSPPAGGVDLHLTSPRFHGRSVSRCYRMMSPIPPGVGNSFEFPWPSSWASSSAPRKGPEPAAPSNGCPLGLREGEPDSQPVRTSSASPVKGIGSFRSHIESNYEKKQVSHKG